MIGRITGLCMALTLGLASGAAAAPFLSMSRAERAAHQFGRDSVAYRFAQRYRVASCRRTGPATVRCTYYEYEGLWARQTYRAGWWWVRLYWRKVARLVLPIRLAAGCIRIDSPYALRSCYAPGSALPPPL